MTTFGSMWKASTNKEEEINMLTKYSIFVTRYEKGKETEKIQRTGWAYEASNEDEMEDVRNTFAHEMEKLYGPCDVAIKKVY